MPWRKVQFKRISVMICYYDTTQQYWFSDKMLSLFLFPKLIKEQNFEKVEDLSSAKQT